MLRPASGRRSHRVLLVVCLTTLTTAWIDAQTDSQPPKYSRLQRLEQWTAALEQHRPGEADGALNTFADWSAREFAEFKITFYSALSVVRDPSIRIFFRPAAPGVRASSQWFYSRDELRQLLAV